MDPIKKDSSNVVQITRNVKNHQFSAKKIMDVIQKSLDDLTVNEDEELPDTLKMTMENPDNVEEPLDFHCEAVKKDDGSVQYECKFVQDDQQKTKMPKAASMGKFSLNVPYVPKRATDHYWIQAN